VAVLALGGGFMLLGRGPSEPSAAPVIKPLHPVRKHRAKSPAANSQGGRRAAPVII